MKQNPSDDASRASREAVSASTVFERAAEQIEREKRLLSREPDPLLPTDGCGRAFEPAPDASDLAAANLSVNPARLKPGTRFAFFKRLLLRLLRLYTHGQVEFNASLLRAVNAWDQRLRRLLSEIQESLKRHEESLSGRLDRLEERGVLWESRLSGRLEAVEDRAAAMEADLAERDDLVQDLREQSAITEEAYRKEIAELKAATAGERVLSTSSYFDFENLYRGDRADILRRQETYIPILTRAREKTGGQAGFLDLGCGRGELLELAARAGIDLLGVDSEPSMAAHCQALGLKVVEDDLFRYLSRVERESLGGISALQVIEHLPYREINRLLALAHEKLRSGGCLILETINPLSVYAMRHFYMDPTHRQPVPETTCGFLLRTAGFVDLETLWLNPVENDAGMEALNNYGPLASLADFLFGHQDYAIVGWKPWAALLPVHRLSREGID